MRFLLVLFILVPLVSHSDFPDASTIYQLETELQKYDVLAIGDTYPQYTSAVFVADVIQGLRREISWVALELTPYTDHIIERIQKINTFSRSPIIIIRLDHQNGLTRHSRRNLYDRVGGDLYQQFYQSHRPRGKGVIFTRIVNLLSVQPQLPKKFGGGMAGVTLAMFLETVGNLKLLRLAVNSHGPWIDKWNNIPPEYRAPFAVLEEVRPDELLRASELFDTLQALPFDIRSEFNFVYSVNLPLPFSEQCRQILREPGAFFSGLKSLLLSK